MLTAWNKKCLKRQIFRKLAGRLAQASSYLTYTKTCINTNITYSHVRKGVLPLPFKDNTAGTNPLSSIKSAMTTFIPSGPALRVFIHFTRRADAVSDIQAFNVAFTACPASTSIQWGNRIPWVMYSVFRGRAHLYFAVRNAIHLSGSWNVSVSNGARILATLLHTYFGIWPFFEWSEKNKICFLARHKYCKVIRASFVLGHKCESK